ncbi:MAG: type II secretion system protein, partial [Gallionellaceae bacterium]
IGMEFHTALIAYANASPPGPFRSPRNLQDLLKDPRNPNIRRYLRKLYADPLTGKEEWGVVRGVDGVGIIGIYSLSDATPIKIGNFENLFKDFDGKTSYSDWKFFGEIPNLGGLKPPDH